MTAEERVDFEDQDLMRRIAQKDAKALEAFYERYYRVAFALVLRIVKVRQDAEDVLAEVFWQIWRQSDRYAPSRGKPLAWLLTIARTRALDNLRASSRRSSTAPGGDEAEVVPSDSGLKQEQDPYVLAGMRLAVSRCLESLSKEQRTPLEMAYFQGMSHTEIAGALNQPLGTMKDRIRTGMMQLRKCLKPYGASA
jgi:RNA polymerase sigma-70 factor (ECF subfamily)